ncbi:MAG TPA: DUF2147 domain-containing protein [Smithellaceae bacterium]|nr:DUF2147 domain-containing protein [Smithellaceae bacterium]HQM44553.1 DUF2147 domain-containing protein [Smithellaceae bacterium]
MKKVLIIIVMVILVVVCTNAMSTAEVTATLIGTWKQIEDQGVNKGKVASHVEIFENNGFYYGKIVKLLLDSPDKVCSKCTGELKNKPLVGMVFLKDMKKTGNFDKELGAEYAGGTILDPDENNIYKCKMWIKNDVLTVRGFIGVSLFGRSAQWFRLK